MRKTALRDLIRDSGMSPEAIAASLKISRVTLNEKINGRSDFKVSEVKKLQKALGLTDKQVLSIFFS